MNDDELQQAVDRIVAYFAGIAPADLERLDAIYTRDAWFKDPFNEVEGLTAVRGVYQHMFDTLAGPRFVVLDRVAQNDQCFLAWEFQFRFRSFKPQRAFAVRGGSHLRLSPDGRIRQHRDYWDAAEEVYEKMPVLGALMRTLKRRARAG